MNKTKNTSPSQEKSESNSNSVLVALHGPLEGQRWMIQKEITIGRAPECDIILPDRQVSRFHARVVAEKGNIELEDLGSKNGTYIGGKPLEGNARLEDGMVFQVALVQKFAYYFSEATLPLEDTPFFEAKEQQGLFLDKKSRRVWLNRKEVVPPLSVLQYKLLELLYEKPGIVISRDELISSIWSDEISEGVSDQALDALIRRLRERLSEVDPDSSHIVTVRGHGLRFQN